MLFTDMKQFFLIPLALSASWDLQAIERCAQISAMEASADGINWTYSPMVDIALDQRWVDRHHSA